MTHSPLVTRAPDVIPGAMVSSVDIITEPTGAVLDRGALCGTLHPEEQALAATLSDASRPAFVAGRTALRAALEAAVPSAASAPLLRGPRGGPVVHPSASGSISHKRTRAIAIAAPAFADADVDRVRHVGIDLELRPTAASLERMQGDPQGGTHRSLAERILTAREQRALHGLDTFAHRDATLLRFALKEAVYKAIDPWVQRYVRFTEVELDLSPAGDAGIAVVTLLLPERPPLIVTAAWWRDETWITATAMSEHTARQGVPTAD